MQIDHMLTACMPHYCQALGSIMICEEQLAV